MQNNEFSFEALVQEYLTQLAASKEKDPNKNPLLLEIRKKLSVAITGFNTTSLYEQELQLSFIDFWKGRYFDKLYEEYVHEFQTRMDVSTDKQMLLAIEVKNLTIDIGDLELTGDIEIDGKKLGCQIAISGDNPPLGGLIYDLTKYKFGMTEHVFRNRDDFLTEEYWKLSLIRYQEIFRKLHWVAYGYLTAKKLSYVKSLSTQVLQEPTLGDQVSARQMSHKQQILLLMKLGVFDLPIVSKLSTQNQGKLFSRLLSRNEKNTEDYIRYKNGRNVDKKFSLEGPTVQNEVISLLKELGIENF
jgi:hypothetical protein